MPGSNEPSIDRLGADLARKLLRKLGTYPNGKDSHADIEQSVVERCAKLADKPDLSADDVKRLLNDCVHGSLCSDFYVKVLDTVHSDLVVVEGGSIAPRM